VKILVTGISGFVGHALAPRLVRAGHEIVGFARDPARVDVDVPVVRGDAVTGAGLDAAMDGVEVAYYLIHAMETSAGGPFAARERAATDRFVSAARRAGVHKAVYLGGLLPVGVAPSPHLASRLAVEEALLDGLPRSTAFRASIVVGARSRSFRFLVRLVERLPALALPPWRSRRTRPIDERDVVELLARAADAPAVDGRSLDVAGPDVLTYGEIVERIRDLMLLGRPTLALPVSATPVASRLAAAVTGEDPGLVGPLMESLGEDLLPRTMEAPSLLGVRLHRFDAAVERALRTWEAEEPLAAR